MMTVLATKKKAWLETIKGYFTYTIAIFPAGQLEINNPAAGCR
jgi:hypothetical protein